MRDANLVYIELLENKIKITPKNGYKMMSTLTRSYYSEAIVNEKSVKYFVSEKI